MKIPRRKRRGTSFALNATSTADISFMLLIFFLVTSSMDVDKGLLRQLPPEDSPNAAPMQIERDNILTITLHADGTLSDGEISTDLDAISTKVEQFVELRGDKHLIQFALDENATYEQYFALQQTVMKAYASLRDKASRKRFNTPYSQLADKERQEIRNMFPQKVAETSINPE